MLLIRIIYTQRKLNLMKINKKKVNLILKRESNPMKRFWLIGMNPSTFIMTNLAMQWKRKLSQLNSHLICLRVVVS